MYSSLCVVDQLAALLSDFLEISLIRILMASGFFITFKSIFTRKSLQ